MHIFNKICKGFALDFSNVDEFVHYYGGEHSIEDAECPNCNKPLILHLTLDTSDTRLNISNKIFSKMPLVYCMRCSLSWYDFQYQILSNEKVRLIQYYEGETVQDDWDEEIGVESFPKIKFGLKPVPKDVESLYDKLNSGAELTEDEESEIAKFTDKYAIPEVGGYPIVDISNQIGGRAFLCQQLDDPVCPGCEKDMYFIASLTNDKRNSLKITFNGVQIVYFYCPDCYLVHVQHSCD
ncbi:MAG: hypothetical protein GY705_30200 [Bacteroidetes bacterium]|nr:hypothetical protein [Bacteroidota bacterium]